MKQFRKEKTIAEQKAGRQKMAYIYILENSRWQGCKKPEKRSSSENY